MWAREFDPQAGEAPFADDPDVVFLFGATDTLRGSAVPADLRARFPHAMQIGCSTGSAVSGAAIEESRLCALALGFSGNTTATLHTRPVLDSARSREAGAELARQLLADDLAGVFLLSVGLGVNGSGLIEGMQDVLGASVPISGGLAGDGARFGETLVVVDGETIEGSIVALALHGPAIRIAQGCFGGWDEFGPRRQVTRSEGSVLFELDGKPALDLYESYLGAEAAELPASGLLFPLKVWDPQNPECEFVRTLLAIDREQRALVLAGDVPQGWHAQLMRGTIDRLVDGAERAAGQARDALDALGVAPQVCLFVSCVGRRLLMGQRTEEEIEAVAGVIGEAVPIIGFYSYGEIARQNAASPSGLHNQTVTLTLLAEAA